MQNVYLAAVRVATLRGRDAEAFGCAERSRARALLDLMAAATGLSATGLPPGLVARWREAGAAVALAQDRLAGAAGPAPELRARLDEELGRLRSAELELRRADPGFWTAVNPQADPAGPAEVAAALPVGATVLQYAIGTDDLFAWAITRDGIAAAHRLHDDRGLAIPGLVTAMVDACAGGGSYRTPADELAKLLLEPLRRVIRGSAALYVVPAGPLARLPFAALPWNGRPLIAAVPVTVLPSAGSLLLATGERATGGRPLVVGNPSGMTYRTVPQAALPSAEVEARRVAGLLGEPGPRLLIGLDATEDRVLAALPEAPVVHFATHGVLDGGSPLGAAILLASGGSLTAAKLFGRRLRADLVVLSACRTGTGPVVPGDELLGLGRALLAAGARSAVVTLWSVDDVSAALVMSEFHRRRRTGEADAVALQSAVAYLRRLDRDRASSALGEAARDLGGAGTEAPYDHPYHWAPYVLVSRA